MHPDKTQNLIARKCSTSTTELEEYHHWINSDTHMYIPLKCEQGYSSLQIEYAFNKHNGLQKTSRLPDVTDSQTKGLTD